MKHFMRLTLHKGKVEAIVTCEDHAECPANTLLIEDEKESGSYSAYPNFFEWYEGSDTPARSGYINLELSERFVKWSYLDEEFGLAPEIVESAQHDLFYEPFFREEHGLVHHLKKTTCSSFDDETLQAYEESLDGFLSSYGGSPTAYRTGFIKVGIYNRDMYGDADFLWEYAE